MRRCAMSTPWSKVYGDDLEVQPRRGRTSPRRQRRTARISRRGRHADDVGGRRHAQMCRPDTQPVPTRLHDQLGAREPTPASILHHATRRNPGRAHPRDDSPAHRPAARLLGDDPAGPPPTAIGDQTTASDVGAKEGSLGGCDVAHAGNSRPFHLWIQVWSRFRNAFDAPTP